MTKVRTHMLFKFALVRLCIVVLFCFAVSIVSTSQSVSFTTLHSFQLTDGTACSSSPLSWRCRFGGILVVFPRSRRAHFVREMPLLDVEQSFLNSSAPKFYSPFPPLRLLPQSQESFPA
jgi:hypothetical protein